MLHLIFFWAFLEQWKPGKPRNQYGNAVYQRMFFLLFSGRQRARWRPEKTNKLNGCKVKKVLFNFAC